ncbi:molybdotransferase-like divisome protein Glp [Catenulispora rubra]|uniref:molybdotransferase-like divisome protein Glp n=1 Tax=Catenulispora rubra TaxID=280293 RepID=UPI0018925B3E|nr:gephyrin-like molybdotransferase Glp [Catenulispora rubra]
MSDSDNATMRSVDDHLKTVLDTVQLLAPMELPITDVNGLVLADDVVASIALPPFDNSSVDGYAVRLADLEGAAEDSPAELSVIGDIAAGSVHEGILEPGTCARIMTGAMVPHGAEAIVPVEWTDAGTESVRITRVPERDQNIRILGSDVKTGEVVLKAGTRLGPRQIGLLAAIGQVHAPVHPHPRVVVLSTGSELVEPGTVLGPGQINDGNGPALTAAVNAMGATGIRVGIVGDDPQGVLDAIEDQLIRADVVITTGGVSVGAYDVVKEVLSTLGTVEFTKVAMQPGMPQGFGTVGEDRIPIFTLPGNPVSAYVSFEIYIRPAIEKMMGIATGPRKTVTATCFGAFTSPDGKRQFARGVYDPAALSVRPVGGHGSHLVGDLALANALIVVPEHVTEVVDGDDVEVIVLDGGVR